jgi:hypothetical protein
MSKQPLRSYQSNDKVMTPPRLARALAKAIKPSGLILEPCAGSGNFVRALKPYAYEQRATGWRS